MANRLWVFDLDGTLIDTMFLYGYSYLDAARLMLEEFGGAAPHVSVLVNLIKSTNDGLVEANNPATGKPFHYHRRRFPTALQESYRQVCATIGREPKEDVLSRLWKIGDQVFDPGRYPGVIKPEAAPLLRQLSRTGDAVVILTKGDDAVQHEKLAALKAAGVPYAAGIVVSDGKGHQFATLLDNNHHEYEEFVAVGDTYAADIEPAVALGYRGIWLATESWQQVGKMDELRARARRDGVTVIEHLRELFPLA